MVVAGLPERQDLREASMRWMYDHSRHGHESIHVEYWTTSNMLTSKEDREWHKVSELALNMNTDHGSHCEVEQ